MTIRHLKTLVAIADHGTFTAAADHVGVTHAAVSQQMQVLEADLAVTLFNRRTRTPILTPLAKQIVAKARVVISDYEGLVPSVVGNGGLSGTLKLGVLRTTLTGLAPSGLALLKERWPELGLSIRLGLTGTLLAAIERGDLDSAIVTKPFLLPSGLIFRPLATETMHLIVAASVPGEDPLHLLETQPYIRFNRQAVLGTIIENWIQDKGLRVQETMELDSPEGIASMVQAGLGVSIVPPAPHRPDLRAISLGPSAPQRELGLIHREDHIKLRAVEELEQALKDAHAAQRSGETVTGAPTS